MADEIRRTISACDHLKRSSYVLLSPRTYVANSGKRFRIGYATRSATSFSLADQDASLLECGDISALSSKAREMLTDIEALVPIDEHERSVVLARLGKTSQDPGARIFSIMPTSYCNMECSYCGQEHSRGKATPDRVQRVINRVVAVCQAPTTRDVHIAWFGGEPLLGLRVIREMSAAFLEAARSSSTNYSATIVTNGSLLTRQNLELLHRECDVRRFEITIDGPESIHNARRLKRNGTGSYRHILQLVSRTLRQEWAEKLKFTIRTNVDIGNVEQIPALIADLARNGFCDPRVQVYYAPIHSWGNDVSDVQLDIERYAGQEARLLRLAHAAGLYFQVLPTEPLARTCIATSRTGELLDSQGTMYSCSEHPLVPTEKDRGKLTNVELHPPEQVRPPGQFDDWYDQIAAARWPCATCPVLPVCGGCCPKLWHEDKPPCPSLKFNWIERLDIAAPAFGLRPTPAPLEQPLLP